MASFLKNRAALKRYAWLSITAAIVNITLKGGAYFLTGSVGLLSDGMEGMVNFAAATMALAFMPAAPAVVYLMFAVLGIADEVARYPADREGRAEGRVPFTRGREARPQATGGARAQAGPPG